ncbi:hypothetical protein [Methanosarcina sp.]|nr:hypothetical protein [Methanosarcina sp.]MDY9925834.1 hypothetical protein [Methanosarcina sp.]
MRNNIRTSDVNVSGNTPWEAHFCQFNQRKEDLVKIPVPYFKGRTGKQ